MKPLLLIVDDEKTQREGLRAVLEDHYDVYIADNAASAIELLESEPFDVLLTDFRMPGENGLKLIKRAKSLGNPPVCILMTAFGSEETAVQAIKEGADDYIPKGGMLIEDLEKKIQRALKLQKLEEENTVLKQQLGTKFRTSNIVGESPVMRHVFDTVEQVAPTQATVLILGESGTGKELIAKAIHQTSNRSHHPMVTVHCAGLSPTLLESELFGHEKGAFTGAHERRIGRFEKADGGTLFLDEIGEIDTSTQIKLLRILGERSFERVGSTKTIKVDVRLLAATNKNLPKLMGEGKFREDLYYRLRVVEIQLPSLRERPTDIPALAMTFLREFAEQNRKKVTEFTKEALDAIVRHSWPGNVRELRAAIEHALVFAKGKKVELFDLPASMRSQAGLVHAEPAGESSAPGALPGGNALGGPFSNLSVEENEKQLMIQALKRTSGNRTEAAKLLGISRRTLHRKMARFKLN
ncbi:sigma-54 dependent transcriptional regulator [Verrucomicrobia bacterium]|nr:sigma-54 dependent transcriptional regulator [Verrucomicrobiota bacterium]MDC0292731.1 sigma-54 dependent transcriptional regulator [Verrucomicrobiota bacterium]MDC0323820.1 sigma-54 dependent transcriptional regulator [Verrucomicrobiota bacterium]